MSCASSGNITKLKQSIFAPFDIYASPSALFTFCSGGASVQLACPQVMSFLTS
jgi:hypothetical protein